LLREAKAAGAVPVSGLEMFVGQAAAQFTLFTGALLCCAPPMHPLPT
jgi:shikimate 5-dehydrogenase